MKHNKGFTLIELLVVIAIIGILSTVVLASLNSARSKGRDAKRMQELQQMHTAIELYINENGFAPDLGDPSCRVPSGNPNCIASDRDSVVAENSSSIRTIAQLTQPLTAHAQLMAEGEGDKEVGTGEYAGGSWDRLAQQLSPYIASLARDPRSGDRGNEYGYVYEAPGAQDSGDNMTYRLYAKKLETKDGTFGYGINTNAVTDKGEESGGDIQENNDNPDGKGGDKEDKGDGVKDAPDIDALMMSCRENGDEEACNLLKELGYL